MRRILFPLLVIGLAGGLFTLGSGAFFTSVQSDAGNLVQAGNLTLTDSKFATNCTAGAGYVVSPALTPVATPRPMVPGANFDCSTTLTNTGNVDGDLYMAVTVTSTTSPSMATKLNISGGSSTGSTGTPTAGLTTWLGSATWSALPFTCAKVADLAAGQTLKIALPTTFDIGADNTFQNSNATLNFSFKLFQNGSFDSTCS